jgi:hypothetical protein
MKWGCRLLMSLCLSAASTMQAESMQLRTRVIEPPEMGIVTIHELVLGSKTFDFMCPPGWDTRVDQKSETVNISAIGGGTIMLRHLPKSTTPGSPSAGFSTPEQLLKRFKGASLTNKGTCMTGFTRTQYYDLSFTSQSGTSFLMRVVQVEMEGARFEIILQSLPHQFKSSLRSFQGFLTSFHPLEPES